MAMKLHQNFSEPACYLSSLLSEHLGVQKKSVAEISLKKTCEARVSGRMSKIWRDGSLEVAFDKATRRYQIVINVNEGSGSEAEQIFVQLQDQEIRDTLSEKEELFSREEAKLKHSLTDTQKMVSAELLQKIKKKSKRAIHNSQNTLSNESNKFSMKGSLISMAEDCETTKIACEDCRLTLCLDPSCPFISIKPRSKSKENEKLACKDLKNVEITSDLCLHFDKDSNSLMFAIDKGYCFYSKSLSKEDASLLNSKIQSFLEVLKREVSAEAEEENDQSEDELELYQSRPDIEESKSESQSESIKGSEYNSQTEEMGSSQSLNSSEKRYSQPSSESSASQEISVKCSEINSEISDIEMISETNKHYEKDSRRYNLTGSRPRNYQESKECDSEEDLNPMRLSSSNSSHGKCFIESLNTSDVDFYTQKGIPQPKSYVYQPSSTGVKVYGISNSLELILLEELDFLPRKTRRPISKLCLLANGTKLVFIDPSNAKMIQCYDLKHMKIDQVHLNNLPICDINTSSAALLKKKYECITACDSKKMILVPYFKNQFHKAETSKEFKSGKFVSADSHGLEFVTGSEDGKIRFYPSIKSKAACTSKEVDLSIQVKNVVLNKDLGYILSTWKNSVILCRTETVDRESPFSKRLKSKLPEPKVIKVTITGGARDDLLHLSPATFFIKPSGVDIMTTCKDTVYLLTNIGSKIGSDYPITTYKYESEIYCASQSKASHKHALVATSEGISLKALYPDIE
ncbi:unnamed protein product [Moneuplotes crassus]|uniref:Uncharacterized protein n=1 Tax=Euplotes crassus TaxID=5936 RepID=A0AAD1Y8G4_EUPCR|nr:unnamed protein product [Moneuplotes crassus]